LLLPQLARHGPPSLEDFPMPVQPESLLAVVCRPFRRLVRTYVLVGALTSGLLLAAAPPAVEAQSLLGSRLSMLRQSRAAQLHGYTYLQTAGEVEEFARKGLLVRVRRTSSLRLAGPSFPYARPEVETFLERLSEQYRGACGEPLYVTSLTRPLNRQPRNASHLSVHPTGMAVDLRRSRRASCRKFLEKTLVHLEDRNVLEATRENRPPHYHVSLFPDAYTRYLAGRGVGETQVAKAKTKAGARSGSAKASSAAVKRYKIARGDSLWAIARRHGVSVAQLRRANGNLSSPRALRPGQVIDIPATAR
jgi:LysM repeat protein